MLIMLLNLKGITMSQKLFIQKIDTADIARNFADFVQKEFKTIPLLIEWLKPVSERFGIIHMTHHSIDFGKITKHYLFLSIDSNKSIIFVGHQFERNDNVITATVDFTDEQKSYLIFEEVTNKVKRYHELQKEIQELQNNIYDLTKAL